MKTNIRYLGWIKIDNIPYLEIKQQYENLWYPIDYPYGYLSKTSLGKYAMICETYSLKLETVKPLIVKKYFLKDWQFQIKKQFNDIEIAIVLPLNGMNDESIIKDMESLGYFVSSKSKKRIFGCVYLECIFEPLYQESVLNDIKNIGTILHISLISRQDSIHKYGFIPCCENNKFYYPDRVYFFKGYISNPELFDIGNQIFEEARKTDKTNHGQYIIYTLDTRYMDIDFFYDPNYEMGLYTYDKVPYNYVIDERNINFNKVASKFNIKY